MPTPTNFDPFFEDPLVVAAEERGPLEPLYLLHVRDHEFAGKREKRARCETCGRAQSNILHLGYPPSLNAGGSGWNPHVFQGVKQAWQRVFMDAMERAGLPKPLGGVLAEAQITFPTRGARDQGNFRFVLEKALGDALQEGGWLDDDAFYPRVRYQFGDLTARYQKGHAETKIILYPSWPGEEHVAPGIEDPEDSAALFR